MKNPVQHVLDTACRLAVALAIAAVAYFVAVTAFHPFSGPFEGYQVATSIERYAAAAISAITFLAVSWRLVFRRAPVSKEVSNAGDAYLDPGES